MSNKQIIPLAAILKLKNELAKQERKFETAARVKDQMDAFINIKSIRETLAEFQGA